MKDNRNSSDTDEGPATPQDEHSDRPEADPAQERGERHAESKQIARGGKTDGAVPGASEDPKAGRK